MLLERPMCYCRVTHLRHHLRSAHGILNLQERQILLKLARGRVKLRNMSCPVCSKEFSYIEKHLLRGHSDLTASEVALHIRDLLWKVAQDELRSLRATNPQIPMVSSFDVTSSLVNAGATASHLQPEDDFFQALDEIQDLPEASGQDMEGLQTDLQDGAFVMQETEPGQGQHSDLVTLNLQDLLDLDLE